MPLPAYDCGVDVNVCCHSLHDLVSTVVGVAHQAVINCLDASLCDSIVGLVTMSEPQLMQGDYLAGWLQSMDPAPSSHTRLSSTDPLPRARATIAVKLMETGYPMIDAHDDGTVPSFEEVAWAALHSYGHAEAAVRAMYHVLRTRELQGCGFQAAGGLVPAQPSGGLVGWRFGVVLDLDW